MGYPLTLALKIFIQREECLKHRKEMKTSVFMEYGVIAADSLKENERNWNAHLSCLLKGLHVPASLRFCVPGAQAAGLQVWGSFAVLGSWVKLAIKQLAGLRLFYSFLPKGSPGKELSVSSLGKPGPGLTCFSLRFQRALLPLWPHPKATLKRSCSTSLH